MIRSFFLGFIKIHILHHAAQEPLYGLSLIEELGRHGYTLSPGTVYPLLHGLTESGYLIQQNRIVDGKVRKYYVITRRGRSALKESRRQLIELVREVVEEPRETSTRRPRTAPRAARARKPRS
jgi:DNA-binding PadR family transcriptional regulator